MRGKRAREIKFGLSGEKVRMEFIDDTRAEFYSTTRKSGSRAECERRGCCRFEVENVDCPLTSSSKDWFLFPSAEQRSVSKTVPFYYFVCRRMYVKNVSSNILVFVS